MNVLWLKLYKVHFIAASAAALRYLMRGLKQEFIEAIDGHDNGISQYPTDIPPRYRSGTSISARVGHLNPAWNQPFDSQTVDVGKDCTISQTRN